MITMMQLDMIMTPPIGQLTLTSCLSSGQPRTATPPLAALSGLKGLVTHLSERSARKIVHDVQVQKLLS